mmetsp:Transcript_798/g.1190  ORF Transcript_798/g.1190 Transcript_798/m.1190 type:complete len:263 (-) Transcript_798:79-867(-)
MHLIGTIKSFFGQNSTVVGSSIAGTSLLLVWGFKKRFYGQTNKQGKATLMDDSDMYPEHKYSHIIDDTTKPVKKSMIYTRTGDKGTSMLYSGERRSKNDVVFEAMGATDELNGVLGIAREYCIMSNNGLDEPLADIQSRLFDIGAVIATPRSSSSESKISKTPFSESHTRDLEQLIDHMDSALPPLTTFILPSGGLSSTHLHLARSICRRAERRVVALVSEGEIELEVQKYLNRLSDFLFSAARYASFKERRPETVWQKGDK